MGASPRSCQFFICVGAPFGPDLGGDPDSPLCGSRNIGSPDKKSAIVEPLGRRGVGPSLRALTTLTWGTREKPKRSRGGRLDVHAGLAIVCLHGSVSTYIQNWQMFVYVGAPLGSGLAGMLALPAAAWGTPRSDLEMAQNPHSLYY